MRNLSGMNLFTSFEGVAGQNEDKTAVFWGERELTYREIRGQARFITGNLIEQFQVRPGDRIGLWLKNCPEFISAMFGILGSGAVLVPINNFLKPNEVDFILHDAGINLLLTDTDLSAHFQALKAARPALKLLNVENLLPTFTAEGAGPAGLTRVAASAGVREESDLAVLIYTSGTTGRPKGAMLTHGNLLHNVDSCRQVLSTVREDRFAVLLPMFHSYMLTVGILLPLLVGGSIVLVKSLHPARSVIQEICERRATVLPAIPQFYRSLANSPQAIRLPCRICLSGSAPLPVKVLEDFERKHGIPLIEGYGLSEASPVVTKNPLDGTRKPGSIGLPIPNVEVTVQDDAGRLLGPGEHGEICVRGGNVMAGYWNQPEETAKAFRGGWLLTGDVGYRDEEGYFYIADRKKDMLLVNGINVYPREIEEVLHQYQDVKEAAVIGAPDTRRGEQPVAFVAPHDGATLDESALLKFVRGKMADYKVPRKIVIMAALPRNTAGKVLKGALRQQLPG